MKYYFLHKDVVVLGQRLKELQDRVNELGKQQGEAAGQSTENFGHDDACQEAIYDERRVVVSQLNTLSEVIMNVVVIKPEKLSGKIRFGSMVELSDGRIFRIGSYMVLANHQVENISYNSPLSKALLGKQKDDLIEFLGKHTTIRNVL